MCSSICDYHHMMTSSQVVCIGEGLADVILSCTTIKDLHYEWYLKIVPNCTCLTACAILAQFSNITCSVNCKSLIACTSLSYDYLYIHVHVQCQSTVLWDFDKN